MDRALVTDLAAQVAEGLFNNGADELPIPTGLKST